MSLQEAERRREADRIRRESNRAEALRQNDDHCVLTFQQWCARNGFSYATGRRLIKAGEGPIVTRLSVRRIGVTVANNRKWQEARSRKSAVA